MDRPGEVSEALYGELAGWWPVLSPPEDYAEETAVYLRLLRTGCEGPLGSVLELGSGGGHIASHVPADIEWVLCDLAEPMLAMSRQLNPTREHVRADMRTLRLGRTFDAVLLHDAVMYLLSEEDLAAAFATAFAHLRPGGAFLVLPDLVAEDFEEQELAGGGNHPDGRAARMLEWRWDPDPTDTTMRVEFSFLLREADGTVHSVYDPHTQGLFERPTFWRLLREADFRPVQPDFDDFVESELFLARS